VEENGTTLFLVAGIILENALFPMPNSEHLFPLTEFGEKGERLRSGRNSQ
jgi:hypothetical protein